MCLPGQADHFPGAILAHEYIYFEVNRVGSGFEAGGINAKSGEDFRPYSDAEFLILSAFGLIDRAPIVVIGHEQEGNVKGHSFPSGGRGCGLAGCGGQTIAQADYIGLDLVQAFGEGLESGAEFRGGDTVGVVWG